MEGFIKIPEDGVYRFYISSDDGSRLYINGILTCDNDGIHGSNFYVKGFAGLKKGFHKIKLEYFEAKYGEDLQVEMEGPGYERNILTQELLYNEK
jgi:alpha-L-fucosidase